MSVKSTLGDAWCEYGTQVSLQQPPKHRLSTSSCTPPQSPWAHNFGDGFAPAAVGGGGSGGGDADGTALHVYTPAPRALRPARYSFYVNGWERRRVDAEINGEGILAHACAAFSAGTGKAAQSTKRLLDLVVDRASYPRIHKASVSAAAARQVHSDHREHAFGHQGHACLNADISHCAYGSSALPAPAVVAALKPPDASGPTPQYAVEDGPGAVQGCFEVAGDDPSKASAAARPMEVDDRMRSADRPRAARHPQGGGFGTSALPPIIGEALITHPASCYGDSACSDGHGKGDAAAIGDRVESSGCDHPDRSGACDGTFECTALACVFEAAGGAVCTAGLPEPVAVAQGAEQQSHNAVTVITGACMEPNAALALPAGRLRHLGMQRSRHMQMYEEALETAMSAAAAAAAAAEAAGGAAAAAGAAAVAAGEAAAASAAAAAAAAAAAEAAAAAASAASEASEVATAALAEARAAAAFQRSRPTALALLTNLTEGPGRVRWLHRGGRYWGRDQGDMPSSESLMLLFRHSSPVGRSIAAPKRRVSVDMPASAGLRPCGAMTCGLDGATISNASADTCNDGGARAAGSVQRGTSTVRHRRLSEPHSACRWFQTGYVAAPRLDPASPSYLAALFHVSAPAVESAVPQAAAAAATMEMKMAQGGSKALGTDAALAADGMAGAATAPGDDVMMPAAVSLKVITAGVVAAPTPSDQGFVNTSFILPEGPGFGVDSDAVPALLEPSLVAAGLSSFMEAMTEDGGDKLEPQRPAAHQQQQQQPTRALPSAPLSAPPSLPLSEPSPPTIRPHSRADISCSCLLPEESSAVRKIQGSVCPSAVRRRARGLGRLLAMWFPSKRNI